MKERIIKHLPTIVLLFLLGLIIYYFNDILTQYNSSLMVVITFVYVVATIEICRANINAAEASKKQLEESKRQYEDKKRLEIVPYIQFEKTNGLVDHILKLELESGDNLTGKYILVMCMKNIGNGTSKDISYTYQWENCTKSSDRGAFPVQALSSGESQTIKVDLSYATEKKDERKVCFHIRYRDLLENAYSQQLNLKFKYNENATLSLIEFTTSSPVLIPKEDSNV